MSLPGSQNSGGVFIQGIWTDSFEKPFVCCPVQGIRFTVSYRQLIGKDVLPIRTKEEHGMKMVQERMVGQYLLEDQFWLTSASMRTLD